MGPINDVLATLGFGRVELAGTTAGVVIAMAQIFAPLMILPLYANMQGIDRRLLGAAQSLGASPFSAFRRAYFPLSLPGILAGSLLVFVLTLGFFITPTLVGSPQNALVSQLVVTQVDQLLAFGRAGAMSVILLAITLLLVAVVALGSRRRVDLASGHGGGGLGEDVGWRRPGTGAARSGRGVRRCVARRARPGRGPDQLRRRGVARVPARVLVDALVLQLLHQSGLDRRHVGDASRWAY